MTVGRGGVRSRPVAPALEGWAEWHPQIRGNRHNERMFAGNGAVAEPFGV